MPVSVTEKRSRAVSGPRSSSAMATFTTPRDVNLMALPVRFTRICSSRSTSPCSSPPTSGAGAMTSSRSFSPRLALMMLARLSSMASSCNGASSMSSRPASILEKSRMSLMMVCSERPALRIFLTRSSASGSSGLLASR